MNMDSSTVLIPDSYIKQSNGFSLDIGGSAIKVVYISKSDRTLLQNNNENDLGSVNYAVLDRSQLDEFLQLVRDKCDLTRDEDGVCRIYTTGIGSNFLKEKIEKELDVELINLTEYNCVLSGLLTMAKHQTPEDLFFERSDAGVKEGDAMIPLFEMFIQPQPGDTIKDGVEIRQGLVEESEEFQLPAILAMCGSLSSTLLLDKDESLHMLDTTMVSGGLYKGLAKLVSGTTDYTTITDMIADSDRRSVDVFLDELIDPNVKGDAYSEWAVDYPVFNLGKAITSNRDEIKDDDALKSLMVTFHENLAAFAYGNAIVHDIDTVYFLGNWVASESARFDITKFFYLLNAVNTNGKYIKVRFLKHGGILGAIGAFMEAAKRKRKI